MSTTWPHGTPPSSVSSRPSTNVRTRPGASATCVTTAAPLRSAVNEVSIEDGGGRGRGAEHPEDGAESEPRLFVLRAEFEGAEVSDRGLVRSPEAEIRFGEQNPRPSIVIVARDGLEERLDRIGESHFAQKCDRIVQVLGGLPLRDRVRRLAVARTDVRLEAMAFTLSLRPDSVDGGCQHVRIVLEVRLD